MNNSNGINNFDTPDEIAIIGMVGRFPGAASVDEFWQNLTNGVESISHFTDEELLHAGVEPDLLNHPNYVKSASILKNIELFDAAFFGFTPREAEITDPQHRLFLESAWSALENAGYDSESYSGQIGIFAGVSTSSYFFTNLYPNRELIESGNNLNILIGNDKDNLTTQTSYKLNLTGPSVNIQTYCSTSLVAVHLACQSLLNGESDIVLAGGVSIAQVQQKSGYEYQEGGIYSPDGHCRTFDANARGTVFGDGVGIVVLKRLADALADGDCIHAVIKSSAINNDGSLKVGYTAPSVNGQREVILEALALAGVESDTITYIEAHGTGTSLGDPIEIAALTQAFLRSSNAKGWCAIGSVKTNIGHLDTASGVTGLIKTVQALKHQQIPPSLHFQQPNPQIDFANSPFYVNTKLSEWKPKGIPRRAGVSSFGIGGTNAHVIVEEAPTVQSSSPLRPYQLLLLSAKTETALETATANLASHLQQNPNLNLADVAHTLQVGRRRFEHRRMLVCHDLEDAVGALTSLAPQQVFSRYQKPGLCPVVLMFSGQGSQYVNMARSLYEVEPTFRSQVDICCEILKPHLGFDIRDILYPSEQKIEEASLQLQQTAITQPALFVIEYALGKLWMEWGVNPVAMIGHSIGEYVAATIAGVFSLEEALAVVVARGKLMQELPSGTMLAVSLSETEVQTFLNDKISLATTNGDSSCVVSGETDAILKLENKLISQGVNCRHLHTSHAFHSHMMQPILSEFTLIVKKIKLKAPQIPFISNVTGTWIKENEATNPNYWSQHLRQTVRFSSGISKLLKEYEGVFLEIGPGRTLSTLARQHLQTDTNHLVVTSLRHPKEQQSDIAFLLNTLGQLWMAGVKINWSGFYADEKRHRLPLPTYPFERQRYWIDAKTSPSSLSNSALSSSEKLDEKQDITNWFYIPSWKRSLLPNITSSNVKSPHERWLLFIDDYGVGIKLINKLQQENKDVVVVQSGEKFTKLNDNIYCINPQNIHDYGTLIKELMAFNGIPQNIAYLWTLNANNYIDFNNLLFITQTLSKQKNTENLKIWVISNNIQQVNGLEVLEPQKSTVLGLCQVIPQEYPDITCRNIDVILPEANSWQEDKLINQIFGELSTSSSDLFVAYRNNYRWIKTFEPLPVESTNQEKLPLKKKGVYLFPGGLDNLGVTLAEDFVKNLQAKLIFLEDSTFPEKEEYSQYLETTSLGDELSNKIKKLLALLDLGAEVLLVRTDMTKPEQIYQQIAPEIVGKIDGVIYSTGITRQSLFSSISEISETDLQELFEFEYQKLILLEQVLREINLDFCVILSSLSSILGGFGLSLYSGVNQLIDTFTQQHNQTYSFPWYVINWDKLQLDEKNQEHTDYQNSKEKLAITQAESIEAFKRILSLSEATQVLVSTVNLTTRSERAFKFSNPDTEYPQQNNSSLRYSRPKLSNSYVAPTNELEKQITEMWQEVLGIAEIGIYDNFYDLGGDSLIATQLISRLRAKFPVDLPLRDLLLQAMIPAKQAEMIEQLLLEKIEELSEEEVEALLKS
ncbi:MAG: acyltransferase domain-containing protein [Scytonematopsis contorta HA4267-MV1]|jgi:acyl transferase domain-containing protein/acyl carrier protein|nr:acyltransferase domain-containing protein [Scytonematopsis contorta HA4267-MV1]